MYVPAKSPHNVEPALRVYAEREFQAIARALADSMSVGSTLNIKDDFGAVGDGVTDDTGAIQAAIDACPEGGTLRVPSSSGHYVFTQLTINKTIAIVGDGYHRGIQANFGDAQYLTTTGVSGSVLRSTYTGANAAITCTTIGKQPRFERLALVGPGSGTSKAMVFGSAASYQVWGRWSDFGVFNFNVGVVLSNVEDWTFDTLRLIAIATIALTLQSDGVADANTTQNVFVNLEVQRCATGLLATEGSTNAFYGGLFQNCTTAIRLAASGASLVGALAFRDLWFENNTTDCALDLTNGGIQSLEFNSTTHQGAGNFFALTNPSNRDVKWLRLIGVQASGKTLDLSPGASIGPAYTYVAGHGNNFAAAVPSNAVIANTEVLYSAELSYTPADTTPTVLGQKFLSITNAGPVTITNLDDGHARQEITLLFNDANTTIQDGSNFQLSGGVNFVSTANDTLSLVKLGTVWYEKARSLN